MVMLNNQRVNLTALRMNMEPVEMVSWQGLHPHFGGIPRWSHLLHVGWGAPATIHAARNSLVLRELRPRLFERVYAKWQALSLDSMGLDVYWSLSPDGARDSSSVGDRGATPHFFTSNLLSLLLLADSWVEYIGILTHRGLIGRVTEPLCHHGMEEPGCESLWITNSLRSAKTLSKHLGNLL